MSAKLQPVEPEILEPQPLQDFTGLDEYQFSGDAVTVSNKRNFLAAYRTQASIAHAAAIAQIARWTVYRYLDNDSTFAQAFEDCKEDTVDTMRTSVYHAALNGNPILQMFWLKAHDSKYRDRLTVDVEQVDAEIRQRMRMITSGSDSDSRTAIPTPARPEQKEE